MKGERRMRKNWSSKTAFLLILSMVLTFSGLWPAWAGEQVSGNRPEFKPNEVIVKFRPTVTRTSRESLKSRYNLRTAKKLPITGAELLTVENGARLEEVLNNLKKQPGVEYAQPNYLYYPREIPNDEYFNQLWGLNNTGQTIQGQPGILDIDIDVPEAWEFTKGSQDVVVAVIDTGVDINHPDLAGRIWTNPGEIANNGIDDDGNGKIDDTNGWDFYNNDSTVYDSAVHDVHGTHVAGTIAAEVNNSIGVAGVAPNVKIMPLKFIGPDGGTTLQAVEAVNYAAAKGVKVSNNSWGGSPTAEDQALQDAINNSNQVFVAAAGNDGFDIDVTPDSPSGLDSGKIIAVAAVDSQGNLAYYSNYGATTVDVAAPGSNILSLAPNNSYLYESGTSMAAPHVAGIAALIYSINPSLAPEQVIGLIKNTVVPLSSLTGKTVTGGMVNAYNALGKAAVPAAPAGVSVSPGNAKLTLRWNVNTEPDLDGYNVYRSVNGGAFTKINSTVVTAAYYTDTGLTNGQAYSYRVSAADKFANESPLSSAVQGIPDGTTPVASLTSPAPGIDTASIRPKIKVTFSEAMDASTITGDKFGLKKGSASVSTTFTYDQATKLATIIPVAALERGTQYTVTVSQEVYDLAGNAMANPVTWSFITSTDTTAPVATAQTPAPDAKDVEVGSNITVTFSKAMDPDYIDKNAIALKNGATPVDINVTYYGSNKTAVIDPVTDLTVNTLYTVTVSAYVYDSAGNPLSDKIEWSFTTGAPPSGSGGGTGGGGGGSGGGGGAPAPAAVIPAPEPSAGTADLSSSLKLTTNTNLDGSATVIAKVSESEFNQLLAANQKAREFILEIKQAAAEKTLFIPANALLKLADKDADIVVKTDSAALDIPAQALNLKQLAKELGVELSNAEIKLNIKELKDSAALSRKGSEDPGMKSVSKVLEFTLEAAAGGKSVAINSFGGQVVKGEFPYTDKEAEKVADKAKLNVYKFNEKTGRWTYVRSKAGEGKVIFYTNTFSKYTIMEYTKTFADTAGHWAKADIELMAAKHVLQGETADKFMPDRKVTRAQFAAMLVRALGLNAEETARVSFKDVKTADWYAAPVAAAAKAGLVSGFADGTFKPESPISREEMAVMAARALKVAGKDITASGTEETGLLQKFADLNKLKSWARGAASTAVKAGIINGSGKGNFEPDAKATRAETAAMLKRLMKAAELI